MNKAYELARAEIGTWEWKEGHNPKILAYFKDAGHAWVKDDETAWCAAFVGAMLRRAGLPSTGQLTARSYLAYGEPVALDDAEPGDIVIFSRGDPNGWQGHVGFYARKTSIGILVLGGNQRNQVNEAAYPVSRLLGIRRIPAPAVPVRDAEQIDPPVKSKGGWMATLAALLGNIFGKGRK